jgi:hypothetical protein
MTASIQEDYNADDPQTQLSTAFVVVLALHVVSVGGIYAYNATVAEKRAQEVLDIIKKSEIGNTINLDGFKMELSPGVVKILNEMKAKLAANSDLKERSNDDIFDAEYQAFREALQSNPIGSASIKVTRPDNEVMTLVLTPEQFPEEMNYRMSSIFSLVQKGIRIGLDKKESASFVGSLGKVTDNGVSR